MHSIHLNFSSEQHTQFAELSGDFNPLHTDPEFARRSQFGTTVVHGVHVVLRVLDQIASVNPRHLDDLQVEFRAPVRPELTAVADTSVVDNTAFVKIVQNDLVVTKMKIVLGLSIRNSSAIPNIKMSKDVVALDRTWEDNALDCEFAEVAGHQKYLSAILFPELTKNDRGAEIDVLLALTRVIGMKCPGRYALLRSFALHRVEQRRLAEHRFCLNHLDSRMRIIRLSLSSNSFDGSIEAHHRRPHVRQSVDRQSRSLLDRSPFAGIKALVVGGSRGLGELTTRAIAAGAGEVLVTYSRGRSDSLELQRELGRTVRLAQLDVFAPTPEFLEIVKQFAPTHLLYFASPQIVFRGGAPWDEELFARFFGFYVERFAWAIGLAEFRGVYTPSSSFVTSQEFGFQEYVKAKSYLEEFCRSIETTKPDLRIVCERLPPIATDQHTGSTILRSDLNLPLLLPSITKLLS